jgi:hypothetical protein
VRIIKILRNKRATISGGSLSHVVVTDGTCNPNKQWNQDCRKENLKGTLQRIVTVGGFDLALGGSICVH